ncbi:MAG: acyltransferase [Spirochaetia bacterium]|nr:acyltransferase [Spirochaetia bacterium]
MYRTEIDGLRAIAVVSVIINHIGKTLLPNGHLGVDIFYVISGFVITQSLVTKQDRSFKEFILGFYNRRVKRLVPALFLCITITSIFSLLIINPSSSLAVITLRTGTAALFGLSNLYLLRQATDYFGSLAELNPFTHTWSLGVEEQFYFLFPFIIWFSGLARQSKTGVRNFSLVIGITGIISLFSYIWLSSQSRIMAFYLMPTRFWELASGSIAYLVLKKIEKKINTYDHVLPYITIPALTFLFVGFFLPKAQIHQEFVTLTVVMFTAVLIVAVRPAAIVYKFLTFKPLVFLGIISYSLYLWHWSILSISRLTIGLHIWSIPFQLAAIMVLSILSYYFVEKPLRNSDWKLLKFGSFFRLRETGYAMIIALSLSALILFLVIPLQKQGYFYTGATAPLIKKGTNTLQDIQNFKQYSWSATPCVLSSNNDVGKVITYQNCTLGDFYSAKRRFLVIGNSFSVAEIEMFKIFLEKDRGSVTVTSSWGASAVPEIENKGPWDKANNYYWNSVIPKLAGQLHTGDVVLMINDGSEFSPKNMDDATNQKIIDLRKGLSRMIEKLKNRGIFIVYQSGNPFMREANCTPDMAMHQWWHILNEPPCTYYSRKESLKRRHTYNDLLLELQQKYSNFAVLELFDVYCPTDVCKFYNDKGIFLYRDEWSHPSVEANMLAQPILLQIVDKLIDSASHSKI